MNWKTKAVMGKGPFLKGGESLFLFFALLFLCSCGSATPSTSIPVPVAGLIAVIDLGDGTLAVSGSEGSVEGSSSVVALNLSVASGSSCSVTSAADGSFGADNSCVIDGSAGDSIQVTQTNADGESTSTTVTAPSGTLALSGNVVAVSVLPASDRGFVATTDGTDSTLSVFNLSTLTQTGTFSLTSFAVQDFDLDQGSGETVLVDADNGVFSLMDTSGSITGSVSVTSPRMVSASAGNSFAVVVHETASVSVSLIDYSGASPSVGDTLAITHPTSGSASHETTFALSLDETSGGEIRAAVLSQFDNGDTIFSVVIATAPPTNTLTLSSQVNLGSGEWGGVEFFSSATETLVTDRTNGRVVRLSGSDFSTQVTMTVGARPTRITINESTSEAFVANKNDNTVSLINLSTNTVTDTMNTSDGVGLRPTDLALDSSPFVVIVGNELNDSVSLLSIP